MSNEATLHRHEQSSSLYLLSSKLSLLTEGGGQTRLNADWQAAILSQSTPIQRTSSWQFWTPKKKKKTKNQRSLNEFLYSASSAILGKKLDQFCVPMLQTMITSFFKSLLIFLPTLSFLLLLQSSVHGTEPSTDFIRLKQCLKSATTKKLQMNTSLAKSVTLHDLLPMINSIEQVWIPQRFHLSFSSYYILLPWNHNTPHRLTKAVQITEPC